MDLCKTLEKYQTNQDEARAELYKYFPKLFHGAIKRLGARYKPWFAEYDDYINAAYMFVDENIIKKLETDGQIFLTFNCQQTISWIQSKIIYAINDLSNEKTFIRTPWKTDGRVRTTRCTQAFDGFSLEYENWENYDINENLIKKFSNLTDEGNVELSLEDKFSISLIEDIIQYLTEDEQKIIIGIYRNGIPYDELADNMGIPRQKAWSIGQSARKKIARYLAEKGIIEPKKKKVKNKKQPGED